MRNARRAAGEGLALLGRRLGRPIRALARLNARAPERLLIAPQDIRTADPTIAADIYAGYFAFAGKNVNTHGRSPFSVAPPSEGWARTLAGFGWLRHLRAADTALARANARALVEDWINLAGKSRDPLTWEPTVAARRLLSWLSQSPMILEEADRDFYSRFMQSVGDHVVFLRDSGARGEARLRVAIALSGASLCASDMPGLQRRAAKMLVDELTRQILPDGGHVSRNPRMLLDLLLDLLPLRQAFSARGLVAPPELLNAIDRMLPMVRLLRLGDGSLSLFNGMGVTQPHVVATVLAYDDVLAAAPVNAPASGYQRLEASGCVATMDTGAPPPYEFSRRSHAGQLSFEFTADGHRLVGNCGSPDDTRAAMREAARATAAHSTLTIADTSSSRFAPPSGLGRLLDGRVVAGPDMVKAARQDNAEGSAVIAAHNGYAREFGLLHERRLTLAADGGKLTGSDRLIPAGEGQPARAAPDYALRFHLHPAVRATMNEEGNGVMLLAPNGVWWFFHAFGLPVEIEPGIYFAVSEGARKAEQIVVQANGGATPSIDWIFERLGAG